MMPCRFCVELPQSLGLKQVGKTRNHDYVFVRRYRCQDCGAAMILSGDLRSQDSINETWFPPGTYRLLSPGERRSRPRPALDPNVSAVGMVISVPVFMGSGQEGALRPVDRSGITYGPYRDRGNGDGKPVN
jgi:hypothetical protein